MKRVIINFSSRKGGNCDQIGQLLMNHFNDDTIYHDFSDMNIHHCGQCQYECSLLKEKCPHAKDGILDIYQDISNCDISYWIIPNYSDWPCANYFTFNERGMAFFWNGPEEQVQNFSNVKKKFILISNSEVDNMKKALEVMNGKNELDVFVLSAKHYQQKSLGGTILKSEDAINDILNFIQDEKYA